MEREKEALLAKSHAMKRDREALFAKSHVMKREKEVLLARPQPESDPLVVKKTAAGRVVVESGVRVQVYRRRWYILLLYALLTGLQSLVYNTFQPMSRTAVAAFSWTSTDITLIANWGAVGFFIFIFPSSWLVEAKGLRVACLVGLTWIAVGCGARCITAQPPAVRWSMHVGQLCNGLGSPVSTAAPPVLSHLWFPPRQRTTATALATVFKFAALAISFIVAPLAVPEVTFMNCTNTETSFSDFQISNESEQCINGSEIPVPPIPVLRNDIMILMYFEAGVAGLLLLAMLVYFPRRPPLPPCVSASIKRAGFLQGLKDLRKHGYFWLLCVLFMLSGGVSAAWVGTLSLNLKPTGISEKQAGWIGFYSFVTMCIALLLTARLGDMFPRYMKCIISVLCAVTCACFIPVCLFCEKVIHIPIPLLYVLVVVGVVAGGSTIPLFYELGCELTYPIGEGTANGILTLSNHIGVILSLSTLVIPQIGITWLNWGVVAAFGITSPTVLLLRETNLRLNVDKHLDKHISSDKHLSSDTVQVVDPSLS